MPLNRLFLRNTSPDQSEAEQPGAEQRERSRLGNVNQLNGVVGRLHRGRERDLVHVCVSCDRHIDEAGECGGVVGVGRGERDCMQLRSKRAARAVDVGRLGRRPGPANEVIDRESAGHLPRRQCGDTGLEQVDGQDVSAGEARRRGCIQRHR